MRGFFDRMVHGQNESAPPAGGLDHTPGPLLAVVLECFEKHGWKLRQSSQPNTLPFAFRGAHATYDGMIDINETDEEFLLLLRAPNHVPENRRLAAAEFLTRANFSMKFGCFELDMADGEVRFKVATLLREGQLSHRMVHDMLGVGLTTLDRFYPGLMAVCFGSRPAAEAIAAIESPPGHAE